MTDQTESVEEFRARAREWIPANLPPEDAAAAAADDLEAWAADRALQATLYDAGFAGICFPREYGGLDLSPAHQQAFNDEAVGYRLPHKLNIPTFAICAAVLLDAGTEEQKRRHIPRILRGEEVWVQLLSEPSGGSDLAGVRTRATRDGDGWVLSGEKIWNSGTYAADYGLCLARTDWTVPKHEGLTMFITPVTGDGVTIQRIKQVNGSSEFCQTFLDGLRVADDAIVGELNDGWTTASRQMFHERNSIGGGSQYVSGHRRPARTTKTSLDELARLTSRTQDPVVREQLAQARIMETVSRQLVRRVSTGIAAKQLPPTASSFIRLFNAETQWTHTDARMVIAGPTAVSGPTLDDPGLGQSGIDYLTRQATSLGGGTTEIARNIIAERVLGMPRERSEDRGVPFNEVRQGRS